MLAHFARHLGLKITDYITMNVPQKGALYRRCKSSSGPATTSVLGRLLLDPKDTPKLGLFLTPFSVSFRGNNRGVLLFFRVGKSVCALFFGVFRHENAAPRGWENCRKSFFFLCKSFGHVRRVCLHRSHILKGGGGKLTKVHLQHGMAVRPPETAEFRIFIQMLVTENFNYLRVLKRGWTFAANSSYFSTIFAFEDILVLLLVWGGKTESFSRWNLRGVRILLAHLFDSSFEVGVKLDSWESFFFLSTFFLIWTVFIQRTAFCQLERFSGCLDVLGGCSFWLRTKWHMWMWTLDVWLHFNYADVTKLAGSMGEESESREVIISSVLLELFVSQGGCKRGLIVLNGQCHTVLLTT